MHTWVDTELVELDVDGGLAISTVGGHGAGGSSGERVHALDRGDELGSVGRVADLEGPVEDDTVRVVEDLGFVSELDGACGVSKLDHTPTCEFAGACRRSPGEF